MKIIVDTHTFLWLLNDSDRISPKQIKHLEDTKEMGLEILAFDGMDAVRLGKLPLHHKDPFDRMIISQALSKNYHIITDDGKFGLYDCKLL